MDEAESFLMKSSVRSIWPHSRAGWFAEVLEGAISRGVAFGRAASRPSAFLGVSLVAALLVLSLAWSFCTRIAVALGCSVGRASAQATCFLA